MTMGSLIGWRIVHLRSRPRRVPGGSALRDASPARLTTKRCTSASRWWAPGDVRRWGRPTALGLTLAILLLGGWIAAYRWGAVERAGFVGVDLHMFLAYAQRWLDTGSMYLPSQLAGPFDPQLLIPVAAAPSLYPPNAIYLFAPFLVLPAILWWAIPLGILGYALWRWRPAPWAWPILALIAALPDTFTTAMVGGSSMWIVAFVAGGLLWGWPAVLVILKPTFLPFALLGIRHRSWWIAAIAMGVLALPLLDNWGEYVAVVRNAEMGSSFTSAGFLLGSLPAMLLPFVAWAGRRREQPEATCDSRSSQRSP